MTEIPPPSATSLLFVSLVASSESAKQLCCWTSDINSCRRIVSKTREIPFESAMDRPFGSPHCSWPTGSESKLDLLIRWVKLHCGKNVGGSVGFQNQRPVDVVVIWQVSKCIGPLHLDSGDRRELPHRIENQCDTVSFHSRPLNPASLQTSASLHTRIISAMSDGFSNDVDPTQCHTRFGILIVLSNMRQRPTAMFLDLSSDACCVIPSTRETPVATSLWLR